MEKIKSIENFRDSEIQLNNIKGGEDGPTGGGSDVSAMCSSGICWTSDYNEGTTTYKYGIYDCDMPPGSDDGGGYSGDNGGLMP